MRVSYNPKCIWFLELFWKSITYEKYNFDPKFDFGRPYLLFHEFCGKSLYIIKKNIISAFDWAITIKFSIEIVTLLTEIKTLPPNFITYKIIGTKGGTTMKATLKENHSLIFFYLGRKTFKK